jgi:D-3-phosphoglycerate dehydrogenase
MPNARRVDLNDLLRESDVVSIHVPGGPATRHMIDRQRLALMKPSATLINTARGDVIDPEALLDALKNGRLRGAALDVYPSEPATAEGEFDTPFAALPNFLGTHHIGASTAQAQEAVALEVVRLVGEFKQRGVMPNCVNMREPTTNCMLVVRMKNKPGSLAHVFQVVSEAGINAEEMDHYIYDGGEAAIAHIRINRMPDEGVVARLASGHPNMIGVEVFTVD